MRAISSATECLTSIFLDRDDPKAQHEVHLWIDGQPVINIRFSGSEEFIPAEKEGENDLKAISLQLVDPSDGETMESFWI